MELIDLIREELLKSAELTGIWEKKLRDIEAKKYDARQFIEELKQQVGDIVHQVIGDQSNRRVPLEAEPAPEEKPKKKRSPRKKAADAPAPAPAATDDELEGKPCPLCGQGHIIKGKTAYGCSRWKEGCTYRKPFTQ
jgi:DNA topoisomerase-3